MPRSGRDHISGQSLYRLGERFTRLGWRSDEPAHVPQASRTMSPQHCAFRHGGCQGGLANSNQRKVAMYTIIDLSSELLVDRSRISDPYLRLMLTAIGDELVRGSPWVAVKKRLVSQYGFLGLLIHPQVPF